MNQIDRHDTFIEGPLYQSRKKVFPQSVSGRFRSIKWRFMAFAFGLYYLGSEAVRHPLQKLHPATRAGLIEIARQLDALVLRWGH